jgi:aerobic-type carbon monoxide dehydrogenase small subunit (CoxS/CutS family)
MKGRKKEKYMTEKKKNGSGGKTRREFLKDAGLLVGGTAIGSTVLLAACGGTETETVTNTVTNTATVTSTAPGGTQTVTSTTTVGAGQTATETETQTQTQTQTQTRFICPIDGMEFDTLAELQAHFNAEHGEMGAMPGIITLHVNGRNHTTLVEPEWPLAYVLRESLGLVGTKVGCDRGECGSCTILVDGRPVLACTMLAVESQGKDIVTIEGLADGSNLHPVQKKFRDTCTFQCGYCTPGMIMSAVALLNKIPNPTRNQVKEGISGNICMCMDYTRITNTIMGGV